MKNFKHTVKQKELHSINPYTHYLDSAINILLCLLHYLALHRPALKNSSYMLLTKDTSETK